MVKSRTFAREESGETFEIIDMPDTPNGHLPDLQDCVVYTGRKYGTNCKQSSHAKYYPENPETISEYEVTDIHNTYDMSSFPRGVVVIFNMHTFESTTGLQDYPRSGTDKDATIIKEVFLKLGFIVHLYDDVSRKELFGALQENALSHSSLSCFICVVLSHGEKGRVYARDSIVDLNDIFSALENPYWVGKPKLFFIQACQGGEHMDGIEPDGLDVVDAPVQINDSHIPLPRQSDFLYAYATASGYSSWRNTLYGSWFIQDICESIRKYSHCLDLSRILTRANKMIALRVTDTDDVETDDKRQVSSTVNQLRKDLYFFPPYGPVNELKNNDMDEELFV